MGRTRSQTIRRARAEQALRRQQEAAERGRDVAEQFRTLAVRNLERQRALAEMRMPDGRRLGVQFELAERIDVLMDWMCDAVGVPRAEPELLWEQYVSAKLDVAEREAENYLAAVASAEARAELLDGVPLEGTTTPAGLIVPDGVL